ncbi:MAG: site-specific DNA-methyltransferase [Prevotellaceae bacterium]|jgi:site-specific DNA-methyltransferase (adenine-specific)|nr:site-specific DNA-methyltransferase [Prevotellaceae bacterium]
MITPFYKSNDHRFTLLHGDCIELLKQFDFKFDMIFADPPYFLSNDGISIQSGKPVSVNKGTWDRSKGYDFVNDFNYQWLKEVRNKLKDNGTVWISGTFHNIFSIAQMLNELEFKILNVVTWVKTNPPPNLACRCFTHSSEIIIWARKNKKVPHYFNYELMKEINDGKQMKDVWNLPAIAPWEKSCGKHPTQKPLGVLSRIILSSTQLNAWILDPFTGSSTTGIAANLLNRKFLGIDKEIEFLEISKQRKKEIENPQIFNEYKQKIDGFKYKTQLSEFLLLFEPVTEYGAILPF